MGLNPLLLRISGELTTSNLWSLKFLCTGHVLLKDLERVNEAKDLFRCLCEKDVISKEDLSFLKELLFRIKRRDLLRNALDTTSEEMEKELQNNARISLYRLLLFSIAEDLLKNQVEHIIFLLRDTLPSNKLEKRTIFDILLEMETSDLLREDKLDSLKDLMKSVGRNDLMNKIKTFEVTRKVGPQQENCTDEKSHAQCERRQRESPSPLPEVEPQGSYMMRGETLGHCLIINNFDFEKSTTIRLKNRKGTEADAEALTEIFRRLRFTIDERKDLTAEAIRQTMESYRKTKIDKDNACFVCCVLSHGKRGTVYGTDGSEVPIKDLTAFFNGRNCPSLAGKPKVFFIQACQGHDPQHGVPVEEDSGDVYESDAHPMLSLPIDADFLVGMATVEDCESYRHIQTGSMYIRCLCDQLAIQCPRRVDLLTILTEVNKELASKVLVGKKQMPEFRTTLRKKLIFPVPLPDRNTLEAGESMDVST
ncbi:caspase-8-like isoform X2 [Ambystoma mexicanum]